MGAGVLRFDVMNAAEGLSQPILEPRRNDLLLGQKLNAALGTFTLQSTDATLRFIISCTNYYISFNHIILMLLEDQS